MAKRRKAVGDSPEVRLGKRVREERVRLGMTQGQLAKRAGMTTAKLSELENARSGGRGPTLSRLVQVAKALGVPEAELLASASCLTSHNA
jgi:transcriptional regulator with XRE-family HTH domain